MLEASGVFALSIADGTGRRDVMAEVAFRLDPFGGAEFLVGAIGAGATESVPLTREVAVWLRVVVDRAGRSVRQPPGLDQLLDVDDPRLVEFDPPEDAQQAAVPLVPCPWPDRAKRFPACVAVGCAGELYWRRLRG